MKPVIPPKKRLGTIYVLENEVTGNIKIGFTAWLSKRLDSLQGANDCSLRLLQAFSGTRELEALLHELCREWNVRGEWFKPESLKVVNLVRDLKSVN